MSKGIWLLPTRRRLEKLQVFFDKAMENGITTPGICLVQKDEFAELKTQYEAIRKPANWIFGATNGEGLANKCQEVFGTVSKLDWVGLACDDLRPQTAGWDKTLVEAVNGRNIVTCNDGQQGNLRMAGITIFSGGLLRVMGYMFPQNFWHTYADNVWEDIGRETHCWTYVDQVLITHDHPFTNQQLDTAKTDETTKHSYGQQQQDIQAYQQWIKNDKEACIARIKAIQLPELPACGHSGAGGTDPDYKPNWETA